jgi:hypothetical protein
MPRYQIPRRTEPAEEPVFVERLPAEGMPRYQIPKGKATNS